MRHKSLLWPDGDAVSESVVVSKVVCLSWQFQSVNWCFKSKVCGDFSPRVDGAGDVDALAALPEAEGGGRSLFGVELEVADEGGALFDGDNVADVVLHSALDGGVVEGVVADEGLGRVAEQRSFVCKQLGKVESEHQVPVHPLHVVETAH